MVVCCFPGQMGSVCMGWSGGEGHSLSTGSVGQSCCLLPQLLKAVFFVASSFILKVLSVMSFPNLPTISPVNIHFCVIHIKTP